jgi:DNA-directed RNA polymerase specialized sigma24 family protein
MSILFYSQSSFKVTSDWRVDAIFYLEENILYFAKKYQCVETTFDDYCQELTFHLWRKLPTYKGRGLKSWASITMLNKCRDIARDRKRTRQRGRPSGRPKK